jgi:hypothetical protein
VPFNQKAGRLQNLMDDDAFLVQPPFGLLRLLPMSGVIGKYTQAVFMRFVPVLLCSHADIVRYSLLFPDVVMPAVDCHT